MGRALHRFGCFVNRAALIRMLRDINAGMPKMTAAITQRVHRIASRSVPERHFLKLACIAACRTEPTSRFGRRRPCRFADRARCAAANSLSVGLPTGDFGRGWQPCWGKDARGLSASAISHLKEMWSDEHDRWRPRDLLAPRYVYV